ncbi:MAG TPA: GNAT family N-acetyltransferase [Limnochordia bacterium]|nr:GNAT family N-acetyltransferase [Bacillota bacterium]HOB09391.1 GNAT family N-acetyltransferase [Limnochordia bacterium]HPZ31344.1 GNAT family N-acetyltransferase [Limnochordia bacterium]HQD71032.1 GNAT family N-acetyltransferase [Limnochordia bacterium]
MRNITAADVPTFVRWWNDGNLMASVGFRKGLGVTVAQLEQRFAGEINDPDPQRDSRRYVIVDLENNRPIGELAYGELDLEQGKCRVGIKICELDYQGKGYGWESMTVFLDYLFERFKLKKIEIDTLADNVRAYNLYKKLGFRETRIEKGFWTDPDGNAHDVIFMEMENPALGGGR